MDEAPSAKITSYISWDDFTEFANIFSRAALRDGVPISNSLEQALKYLNISVLPSTYTQQQELKALLADRPKDKDPSFGPPA